MQRWIVAAWLFASAGAQAACTVEADHLAPVLELYTSEGCSSCPPADRWMSSLARAPIDAVPLAFHVDYWDDLGWKDRFASPAHTRRQHVRVAEAGGRVVYTPQAMLGEDVQVKWNDGDALAKAAARNILRPPGLRISLRAERVARGVTVQLASERLPGEDWLVEFALYRDGETSVVTAGENRRLTLHHDRVVSALHGPWPVEKRKPFAKQGPPPRLLGGKTDATGIVAIFHLRGEPGTGWALDLPLGSCADEPDAAP